jgi:two-component system sensor histidine kinase DctS
MGAPVTVNTRTGRSWRPRLPGWRRPDFAVVVALMPLAIVLVMAALTALLVGLAERRERAERATALIRDALWVEQALRFQITACEETLERTALDIAAGALAGPEIAARLRAVAANHPELALAEWLPAGTAEGRAPADPRAAAGAVGRPRFGEPVRRGDAVLVDLVVPAGDAFGTIHAAFQLDRLLAHHVPWWITQMNAVALVDRDGTVLASKSAQAADPGAGERHAISLDPPLPGVTVMVARRTEAGNLASYGLVAAVFVLSGIAAVSIYALQRHWRRRLDAETDLREAHAFRKAMEESLTIGMRARDRAGRIIYVNPAFCRMVGLPPEKLIGMPPPQPYWVPELVAETLARHQELGASPPRAKSFETRFRHMPDGRTFDVLVYEAPLIDAQGLHRGWMGSIIDLTDRKAAEATERQQAETLQRAARLTAVGEMASTIAHELNQPLAAIASYAAGALNRLNDGTLPADDLAAALRKLDEQAQRAGKVLRRVHDFVRKREPAFAPLALPPVVDDLAVFLTPLALKAGVQLETQLPADLPPVRADRILIEQVLLNLVRNAIEAMAAPPGIPPAAPPSTPSGALAGTLAGTLAGPATAPAPAPTAAVTVAAIADGETVALSVADRGPGIEPAIAERLFQPFVSSKPEGMGMGLNICRSVVELHQGRLDWAPRAGGGTVFTVVLPRARPAATQPAGEAVA